VKTEDLIVELAASLRPVDRLASPAVRVMRWTIVSFAITAVGVMLLGPRRDISAAVGQTAFVGIAVVTICTALAAAAAALVLSVPGAERTPARRALPIVLLAAWALLLVGRLLQDRKSVV